MAILLGEWGFRDDLQDSSGNGRHASSVGPIAYSDGPQANTRAVSATDPNSTIQFGRTGLEPASEDGGIVTMGWVRIVGSHSGYTNIINKARGFDSTKHAIKIHNGAPWLMSRWKSRLSYVGLTDYPVNDGQWHHIANIDSDNRFEWIVDGVAVTVGGATSGTNEAWADYPWDALDTESMTATSAPSNVEISGVRLFSGDMTTADVVNWMNTPIEVQSTGPTWSLWNGTTEEPLTAKLWDGTNEVDITTEVAT